MTDLPAAQEETDFGLRKVLNRHGYGFQQAVLQKCVAARIWQHAVSEYPVELNRTEVHVDFILGFQTHLLVAECKKVDGWRWGFARGNSNMRGDYAFAPRADFLRWTATEPRSLSREPRELGNWRHAPYDVSVELRHRPRDDDGQGATSRALDQAVAQVLRARGGLMQDLANRPALRYGGGAIIPVIFTTAPLVMTDDELWQADLHSGELGALKVNEDVYLWYDHNLSPSLQPSIARIERDPEIPTKTDALQHTLDRDLTKSIAIVTPDGIERFLRSLAANLAANNRI